MNYDLILNKIRLILTEKQEKGIQEIIDLLYNSFDYYNWIGIYILKDDNLHLGPWKGNHATEHTIIPIGHGICGAAAESGKTEIISDVRSDKRYLACFISTRSEIVIPIKDNDAIIGEIDIDSDKIDAFSKEDADFLEDAADMISS